MGEKVRLGGMALSNGVLVHGPTSWACAVRTDDGTIKLVAERKRMTGSAATNPLLRGPACGVSRSSLRPFTRRVPEARRPSEPGRLLVATPGAVVVLQGARRARLGVATREVCAALLAPLPAVLALRGDALAAYH